MLCIVTKWRWPTLWQRTSSRHKTTSSPCKNTQGLCQPYLCRGWMYRVDFPENDALSAFGTSEHWWEGRIWGLWVFRVTLKTWYILLIMLGVGRVAEGMRAMRAVINILLVWFQDHMRNYTRFLHLLLKGEACVCVCVCVCVRACVRVIGCYRHMWVSEDGSKSSQVLKYPHLLIYGPSCEVLLLSKFWSEGPRQFPTALRL